MKLIVPVVLCFYLLFSCKQKEVAQPVNNVVVQSVIDTVDIKEAPQKSVVNFNQILTSFETKVFPVKDTTNYNNVTEDNFLSREVIIATSLNKIYPNFFKETHNYKVKPNYKIDLTNNYNSLVFIIFKGENELESTLINYTLDGAYLDHKVIAYDEIAEGWSQKNGIIQKDSITITDILWLEEKQESTTTYRITSDGKIEPITNNN